MFIPALILIAAIIPMWKAFRDHKDIKIILEGLNTAAVGLVFAATYSLLQSAITPYDSDGSARTESILEYPIYTILTAVTFTSQILGKWNLPAPLMVLVGGLVGVFQWLAAGSP
jgi:chromate transport protein ChrA